MARKFEAALFDIDGTILNTSQFVFQALRHSLKTHRGREVALEDVTHALGKPLEECYLSLEPNYDPKKLAQTHKDFQKNHLHLSRPFEYSADILKRLSDAGIKIAAVTSRGSGSLNKTLELAGILSYFDVLISADDVSNHKPHPEPVLKALERLRITSQRAIMVGDSEVDVLAGKQAGTKTIGVTYGFHGEEIRKSNPDYVVNDIKGVLPLILE